MRRFSQILSVLLYPMFVPTYATILLCVSVSLRVGLPHPWCVLLILGTFVLTCVLPCSAILLFRKRGVKESLLLVEKETRRTPYLYALISAAVWCFFLAYIMQLPSIITCLALGALATLALVMLINYKWKISAHLAMMGVLVGSVLGYCSHNGVVAVVLWAVLMVLSWLLCIARLQDDAHTPMQVTVAFLMGLVVTFAFSFLAK